MPHCPSNLPLCVQHRKLVGLTKAESAAVCIGDTLITIGFLTELLRFMLKIYGYGL